MLALSVDPVTGAIASLRWKSEGGEIEIVDPLVSRGLVSEVEALRLKRQRNDLALQLTDRRNRYRADAVAFVVENAARQPATRRTTPRRAEPGRGTGRAKGPIEPTTRPVTG